MNSAVLIFAARCLQDVETERQFPMSKGQKREQRKIEIAPMLSVRNGVRVIEFYKAAFGKQELYRVDSQGGAVVAELSVGESESWLADQSSEHLNFSPESLWFVAAKRSQPALD